ncbi:MAG: DegT/DnrJ/EryC1/StrS family aminotransferase [Candidatus Auribacterota bacterium]|jgi:dTDP-4-amino-4,6-dideoxygalactose transaminase|nr:DegT/DnrJ/EryC1/StrS family aminotransferase [Candidatus Auribacterota bacterium]
MSKTKVSSHTVPFFKASIGKEEEQAVLDVLRSGWLTTGPRSVEFERLFCEYTGARHAVALSSCTAALHLALEVLDLHPQDEIITTPFTFSATASEILHAGAKIRFVDVNPETGNIDELKIREAISERTRAILPVHFAGNPCAMDTILELALEYDLRVIEDAAHALESRFDGQKVGAIGDFTCFSFYATKNITTAEGGMLTCDNDVLAEKIRMLSLHGMSRDAWKRYLPAGTGNDDQPDYYQIMHRGYKYNLSDLQAALGIVQLKKADLMWQKRKQIVELYRSLLADVGEIEFFSQDERVTHGNHLFAVKLNTEQLSISRNRFVKMLKQAGIGCSIHFISLHLHPYYKEKYRFEDSDFPCAADLSNRVVTLPLFPDMNEFDVRYVADTVKSIINEHKISKLVSVNCI